MNVSLCWKFFYWCATNPSNLVLLHRSLKNIQLACLLWSHKAAMLFKNTLKSWRFYLDNAHGGCTACTWLSGTIQDRKRQKEGANAIWSLTDSAAGHTQKPVRESEKNTNVRWACGCQKKKKKVKSAQSKEEYISCEWTHFSHGTKGWQKIWGYYFSTPWTICS